jgi:hypothetical protein
MKKIYFLLAFALMIFTVSFAQETTTIVEDAKEVVAQVEPTITQAERIIDKYGGKAIDGFNSVVEKVVPMAEQGFVMAVKLQIAKGIANLIPMLFFVISLILFVREYKRIDNLLASENTPENYTSSRGVMDEYNITPLIIVTLVLIVVSGILTCICTYDAITHLVAPEWYAMKEIIELFK